MKTVVYEALFCKCHVLQVLLCEFWAISYFCWFFHKTIGSLRFLK
jgi:hypothetical protein